MPLSQIPTRLRRTLYVFAAALAVIVALPLIDLASVKQRIVHDASDSLGRHVAVGAVRFALLPSPNVTLEDVSMTEPDGRTPFARWESARFSLGWTALWRGRAELVDGRIQGLWASVKATSAGHFNIDDLLTRRPKSSRIDWRPQRVDLVGASLDWQDVDGRVTHLRNVDLHAINPETDNGAVTLQGQVSAPDWGGGLRLDSGLRVDRPHLTAQLPGFKLRINADVPDWREGHTDLNGDVVLSALPWRSRIDHAQVHAMAKHGDQLWQLAFDAAQLRLDERGFSTDALEGELGIKGVSRELAGRWKIQKLAANETGTLVAQTADLHAQLLDEDQNAQIDLAGTLRINDWRRMTLDDYTLAGSYHNKALPRGAIKLALSGSAQLDLGRERLNWDSHGTLDGAPITTQFSLENFIDTKYVLGLDLGKLDLTPYLPSSDSKAPAVDTARKLNFSWLNDLEARADVKLGELDLGRFRVFNLQTHVEAGGRKLHLEPLSADIYGGRLTGKLTLDDTKMPRIQLRQSLTGMEIAALLSDTLGIDPLAGRGTVELDVSAPATSVDAMRNGLSGDAQLTLARGYITGLDIGDALRGLHLGLADIVSGVIPPDNKRRTQFSNMSAHIAFRDGVAESHDLNFRAPFLSMGGDGHIDLPHNRVDTVLRAKVLGGSGVAAFDALKGVEVPIEITGPLSSPHYHVDAHAIPERLSEPPQRDAKAHG
jgi:uncharacterized protein involved in outer membrane biogenesis